MERLCMKHKDVTISLETLGAILEENFSIIVCDATIQRFEYTFEAVWKFLKEYLKEKEGVICNSHRACFREIFSLGFLSEDDAVTCLEMTDRRNDISCTYKEEVAQVIYAKIKGYFLLMNTLIKNIAGKI